MVIEPSFLLFFLNAQRVIQIINKMKIALLILSTLFCFNSWAQYNYKKDQNEPDFLAAEAYRLSIKNKDDEKAYKLYLKSANNGNAAAMNQLGWLIYQSNIKESYSNPNRQKDALNWFQKAAEKGNGNAMFSIGWLHLQYDNTVSQDYKLATEWFSKGASAGSARSMYWLGYMYNSSYIKSDLNKTILLWNKASELGDPLADDALGFYYFGEKNYVESLKYYQKAYKEGNNSVKSNIARFYKDGLGVAKNEKLAEEWDHKPFVKMDNTK